METTEMEISYGRTSEFALKLDTRIFGRSYLRKEIIYRPRFHNIRKWWTQELSNGTYSTFPKEVYLKKHLFDSNEWLLWTKQSSFPSKYLLLVWKLIQWWMNDKDRYRLTWRPELEAKFFWPVCNPSNSFLVSFGEVLGFLHSSCKGFKIVYLS